MDSGSWATEPGQACGVPPAQRPAAGLLRLLFFFLLLVSISVSITIILEVLSLLLLLLLLLFLLLAGVLAGRDLGAQADLEQNFMPFGTVASCMVTTKAAGLLHGSSAERPIDRSAVWQSGGPAAWLPCYLIAQPRHSIKFNRHCWRSTRSRGRMNHEVIANHQEFTIFLLMQITSRPRFPMDCLAACLDVCLSGHAVS